MSASLKVAVIGHGNIGARIAGDLASAGADVVGFDVRPPANPTVPLAASIADAVAGADVVLSINASNAALRIAEQIAPHLGEGALFADLNTAPPALKNKLAELVPTGSFVDVAVMSVDGPNAPGVELAAAGPSAERFIELMAPFATVEFVSAKTGDAAARLLTRSILAKCMAGVVVDYMWAAEAMGVADWAYDELLSEFDGLTAEAAKRYLAETVANPKRAEIEMVDIIEMLGAADYHSIFVPPTQLIYNRIYHSIKVPFGTVAEQERHDRGTEAPAADW